MLKISCTGRGVLFSPNATNDYIVFWEYRYWHMNNSTSPKPPHPPSLILFAMGPVITLPILLSFSPLISY